MHNFLYDSIFMNANVFTVQVHIFLRIIGYDVPCIKEVEGETTSQRQRAENQVTAQSFNHESHLCRICQNGH